MLDLIVLGLLFISIIIGGLAYTNGYIPQTERWGLKKMEEIKNSDYSNFTKLGDKPDNTCYCIIPTIENEMHGDLRAFCVKYRIPMIESVKDSPSIEDGHLVYNGNIFKATRLQNERIMIKNLTILNEFQKKLKELEPFVDKLELEVTLRLIDIQLSNNTDYTYLSNPIIYQ